MIWEEYVCVSASTDGLRDWPTSTLECKRYYE